MSKSGDTRRPCHCCGGTGTEIDQLAMGRALRGLRISSGRTLNSVARQMKISGPYLSDLERGRRNWNHKLIAQFKETVTE